MDELNNNNASAVTGFEVTSPDFTTLGTADPVDWLVNQFTWSLNRSSRELSIDYPHLQGNLPIVAYAVDSTGGSGTGINTLTPGFQGIVNTSGGVRGITLTQEMIDSLQAALVTAGIAATAGLVVTDLTTAGTGDADTIILQALDREPAYADRVASYKVKLDVGLTTGFDSTLVYSAEGESAFEGEGLGRQVALQYKLTHGQRKYHTLHEEAPVVEFPNPIDTALNYNQIIIQHQDAQQIDVGSISVSPQKGIVAIPTANTTLIAAVVADIDALLASVNQPAIQVNP